MAKRKRDDGSGVSLDEYRDRRARVLKALDGAAGVIFAGDGVGPDIGRWRADRHFLYLTGIEDERGAAVLFDPANTDPKRRCILLLRPIDPERDQWDGFRASIGEELRARTAFDKVFRINLLPALLTDAARRTKRLACLHSFSTYPAPVSADLAVFRQVSERIPGVTIEDRTQLLKSLRAIKSDAELALMRRAIDITRAGFAAAMSMMKPGVNERAISTAIERAYFDNGATSLAFNTIVGGGANATVLHYEKNDAPIGAEDLVVIDSGAAYTGYAADVTRTIPASGKFTRDQRDVYETVLRAEEAAIRASKPGVRLSDIDAIARDVIERAGFGDAFVHSIGHPLGLDVHDVSDDAPLRAGMVITIEPGVYLTDRKLGVRIEDDVLITRKGCENLSSRIPKTVRDIEAAMSR
jgi:Xaa-Pro aminopeptidase